MERTSFDAARRYAETSFGKVAYVEQGEGPAALFCHGAMLNGYQWRDVIDRCAESRRVIAFDDMGHGHTKAKADAPADFAAHAQMLEELLDGLGIDQVDIVGNDSGGAIAQVFAVRSPQRVRSMALANCDARDSDPSPGLQGVLEIARSGALGESLKGLLAVPDVVRSPEVFGALYEHPEKLATETIEAYLTPIVDDESTVHALERFMAALEHDQLRGIENGLRQLQAPTLIMWGTADTTFEIERAHWLADTIPGARPVVPIDGAKLFWPEERPDELARLLQEHWATAA
jgi:pimeloyl-ACP methyl ester carboxylesterase